MAEPSRSFEAFTADLAREAQALGIAPTNHLAAAREPQVSWRASMLPLVNYDDGTGGFGWPQMAVDAKNALDDRR